MNADSPHVLWFEKVGRGDVAKVGGKNASLGEMVAKLAKQGVRVPPGFATTADAYWRYLEANGLQQKITDALGDLAAGKAILAETGAAIRGMFLRGEFPPETAQAIRAAYRELCKRAGKADVDVAVRSSATAEDLPDASFAGQQETYLNIRGDAALLDACRRCYASLFTDRAISYRQAKGFDHMKVALSVGVQRMVRSDIGGSGVMFSIDTETGFDRVVLINAAWGLGENVVQGAVDPDEYVVFKPLLANIVADADHREETRREGEEDDLRHRRRAADPERADLEGGTRGLRAGRRRHSAARPLGLRDRAALRPPDGHGMGQGRRKRRIVHRAGAAGDGAVAACGDRLPHLSYQVEGPEAGDRAEHRRRRRGGPRLPDRKPARDRPLRRRRRAGDADHRSRLGADHEARGGDRHRSRRAHLARGHRQPRARPAGGGRHRERHAGAARRAGGHRLLRRRRRGLRLRGHRRLRISEIDFSKAPATRTKIMLNMANPAAAFRWWRMPADGVGLARMEFVVSNHIKVHPMALVHYDTLKDAEAKAQIAALTVNYADKHEYFVDRLARGLARIAAAFHPRPVIVRMSDFKTNEYAGLIGGAEFEPKEENPMLGFRGASRYYSPRYKEGFALECRAIHRLREQMGFSNVIVMIPFCRSTKEADRVLEVMAENGLKRGENGLQVYVMCEIPSNVILAKEFAQRFDGFSIGSNDLTQLTLGVDRDSSELAGLFDEQDEAVKWMIRSVIEAAHQAGAKVGLCGQAPSDHPEFAEFLVDCGIDSMSVSPDSFLAVKQRVAAREAAMSEPRTTMGAR